MTQLPTRLLGRTAYKATILGFGASMTPLRWRNGRPITLNEASRVFNQVLDAGINFIDTSPDYGKSEEYLGSSVAHRRREYFLATKCGRPVDVADGQGSLLMWCRRNIVAGVERSLRRMRTDYIDLLQIHGTYGRNLSPAQLQENQVIETLRELQQQGKVRFIGASSTLPELAQQIELGVFDAFQIPYNALERESGPFITAAATAGAGTIIRGATGKGVLSHSAAAPSQELFKRTWSAFDDARIAELLENTSKTEFMLRYVISHPDVTTVIVGTLDPAHLATNLLTIQKGPLSPTILSEVTRRLEAVQSRSGHRISDP